MGRLIAEIIGTTLITPIVFAMVIAERIEDFHRKRKQASQGEKPNG